MKVGIMQPYFMPYIGYFQLLNAVDKYVIYDNIQYTKKGWINRNRILQNRESIYITLPLKKDSDFLNIQERSISTDFNRKKLLNQIISSYQKAPYFKIVYPVLENIINFSEHNLFSYLYNSIKEINLYLGIKTEIIISSDLSIDHTLKSEEKVIAICKALNATEYYNAVGGYELYKKEDFRKENMNIFFLKTGQISYPQYNNGFIPDLSIIDVMMFNSVDKIYTMLDNYELI